MPTQHRTAQGTVTLAEDTQAGRGSVARTSGEGQAAVVTYWCYARSRFGVESAACGGHRACDFIGSCAE
jgi:hypothetical protein